jgi:predicted neuraminidase
MDCTFDCCHASTLAVLPNRDLLVAWFGGTKEGADDVAIWTSRREHGIWSAPVKTSAEEGVPHWNPVLLTKPDGKIMLFYKVGRKISKWYTKLKISEDNGLTWSDPAELVPGDRGGRGPVRNKVILLSNGTWLAPASTEKTMWKAFVDISKDNGITWSKSNDITIKSLNYTQIDSVKSNIPVSLQSFEGRGVIQPTLWESEKGKVHMLMRSSEGRIYRSDSSDYGENWSDAYSTVLPNNNSGIDLVCLDNGILVLAFNPVGVNWGPRTPIVLRTSLNNGKTWGEELVMENDEGEYSYPCVNTDGKHIYVTYTWKRKRIAFLKLSVI